MRDTPRLGTLASLFTSETTADRLPAIMVDGDVLSRRDLFVRVGQFVNSLDRVGSQGQLRVAINSPKSLDAYALELAAIAVGATFCPINVDAPSGRNEQILADFRPHVIFRGSDADESLGRKLTGLRELVIEPTRVQPVMRPRPPAECAYVIYTSGTTGYAKGVRITYANLDWFLTQVLARLSVPRGLRWSNHPNLAFDLSILDLFGAVASRSTLVPIRAPLERAFPARMIAERQINVWHSVPSIVESLQRSRAGEAGLLRSLEIVILCGEPCRRSWVEYLLNFAAPNVRVYNAYGPTETTVFCSVEEMNSAYRFDEQEFNVPIGSPFPGVEFELRPWGSGDSELIIRGPGVGMGYVNVLPGEANGYVDGVDGVGAYRTGDLVQEVRGSLYYRGRLDDQVKLKGHRFELGEIEGLLASAGIDHAYCVVVDGIVVLFLDVACDFRDDQILEILRPYIPAYAIPRRVLRLDNYPRNVNDKVDRRALTSIAMARIASKESDPT